MLKRENGSGMTQKTRPTSRHPQGISDARGQMVPRAVVNSWETTCSTCLSLLGLTQSFLLPAFGKGEAGDGAGGAWGGSPGVLFQCEFRPLALL